MRQRVVSWRGCKVEPLVQFHPAAKGRADQIPCRSEQPRPLLGACLVRAAQVVTQCGFQLWVDKVRLRRRCEQVVRADGLEDVVHAHHPARHGGAQRIERPLVADPGAVAVVEGAVLGGLDGAARQFRIRPEFAQHVRNLAAPTLAGHVHHARGEFVGELQLHQGPNRRLLHDVAGPAAPHHAVEDLRIAVAEDPRSGHFNMIEDDEGVLLVEAAGKRRIERVAAHAVVVPAEDAQARRSHGDGERQGDLWLIDGHGVGRIDRDLIGERAERRQDPGAVNHDGVRRFVHLAQRQFAVDALVVGDALVNDGVDDGVGQRQIPLGDLALEGDEIVVALFVAGDSPQAWLPGEAGKGDVQVVRRPSKHAHAVARGLLETPVPARQILPAARNHVADMAVVAGTLDEARFGMDVLPVEVASHAGKGTLEGRMAGDIGHRLAIDAHGPRALQAGQVFRPRACNQVSPTHSRQFSASLRRMSGDDQGGKNAGPRAWAPLGGRRGRRPWVG